MIERLFNKSADAQTLLEETDKKSKLGKAMKEIYRGVKIQWGKFGLGFVANMISYLLLATTATTAANIQLGKITDYSETITFLVIHLVAWAIGLAVIFGTKSYLKVGRDVQEKLWKHIVRLPLKEYAKEDPNRLISRITVDADASTVPFILIQSTGMLLAIMGVGVLGMPSVDGTIKTVFFIGMIIVFLMIFGVCGIYRRASLITSNRVSKVTAFWSERLFNLRLIKASCAEKKQIEQADHLIEMRFEARCYSAFGSMLVEGIYYMAALVGLTAAFLVGAILMEQGANVDTDSVYTFYTYSTLVSLVISAFILFPVSFAGLGGTAERFVQVLKTPTEDVSQGGDLDPEIKDIRFENVSFGYDENDMVLRDINCVIPAGKVTALVGTNGSGKSTMIKLIDRLYPVNNGDLYFGQGKASDVSLKAWRKRFGVVSQNASLFAGSIRSNVCYGIDREITDEELESVAKLSGLDNVLARLPEGWDTDVGMAGCRLSGGEQQRVSIARALIKDPDYLILDEATANLDAESAHNLVGALKELMQGRTTIMVAHNEELIQAADHIIEVRQGRVAS